MCEWRVAQLLIEPFFSKTSWPGAPLSSFISVFWSSKLMQNSSSHSAYSVPGLFQPKVLNPSISLLQSNSKGLKTTWPALSSHTSVIHSFSVLVTCFVALIKIPDKSNLTEKVLGLDYSLGVVACQTLTPKSGGRAWWAPVLSSFSHFYSAWNPSLWNSVTIV